MSVNKYSPHVLVLPEDDANRQIARGFALYLSTTAQHIKVLNPAGGWLNVLEQFKAEYSHYLRRFPNGFIVLLIDFDEDPERLDRVKQNLPIDLQNRVFILGTFSEPEALRQANLGSFEAIGLAIAKDCHDETDLIWGHSLLQHNASELDRLRQHVRPVLFA
jgi:hypothetical protein